MVDHFNAVDNLDTFDNVYDVEKIVDYRPYHGYHQYLIKWEGYPDSENSWVFDIDISADDVIEQFWIEKHGMPEPPPLPKEEKKSKRRSKRKSKSKNDDDNSSGEPLSSKTKRRKKKKSSSKSSSKIKDEPVDGLASFSQQPIAPTQIKTEPESPTLPPPLFAPDPSSNNKETKSKSQSKSKPRKKPSRSQDDEEYIPSPDPEPQQPQQKQKKQEREQEQEQENMQVDHETIPPLRRPSLSPLSPLSPPRTSLSRSRSRTEPGEQEDGEAGQNEEFDALFDNRNQRQQKKQEWLAPIDNSHRGFKMDVKHLSDEFFISSRFYSKKQSLLSSINTIFNFSSLYYNEYNDSIGNNDPTSSTTTENTNHDDSRLNKAANKKPDRKPTKKSTASTKATNNNKTPVFHDAFHKDVKGKVALIFAPKAMQHPRRSADNDVQTDAAALQYLLLKSGAHIVEDVEHQKIEHVFIHATELDTLTDLRDLDKLKSTYRPPKFFIFGLRKRTKTYQRNEVDVIRRVWDDGLAVTFTPKAISDSYDLTSRIIDSISKRTHYISLFFHIGFIVKGGVLNWQDESFTKSKDDQIKWSTIVKAQLSLTTGTCSVLSPLEATSTSRADVFPTERDSVYVTEYSNYDNWGARLLEKNAFETILEFTQNLRHRYVRKRRWIIICTPDEVQNARDLHGIEIIEADRFCDQLGH